MPEHKRPPAASVRSPFQVVAHDWSGGLTASHGFESEALERTSAPITTRITLTGSSPPIQTIDHTLGLTVVLENLDFGQLIMHRP
jgi:hypothetical protein